MIRIRNDLYRNFAFGFGAGAVIVLIHFFGTTGGIAI